MAERDVIITVSAKNLIEAEFAKVKKGLAGISASEGVAKKIVVAAAAGLDFHPQFPGGLS